MDPKITVQGKTYNSLNELPPELQSILKDENGNGIPDIMESSFKAMGASGKVLSLLTKGTIPMVKTAMTQLATQKFVVGGKEYNSWSEVPESAKTQIREKLKNLANQNGASNPVANSISTATRTFVSQPTLLNQSQNPYMNPSAIPGVHQVKTGAFQKVVFVVGLIALGAWLYLTYAK